MSAIKKYDVEGKEVGEVKIDQDLLKTSANTQMVKDYIIALRANARQWSASTKTRAEVNHSGQKPHPQKGTGRARQGYLGSPQYKGGGRPGGPRPKFDQHVKVNRKEKKAVVRQLLVEKILDNRLHVLEFQASKKPKTKKVAAFLQKLGLQDKKVLFLAEVDAEKGAESKVSSTEKYDTWVKSMRNISATSFLLTPNISGYDILAHHDLVVMDEAVDDLKALLGE